MVTPVSSTDIVTLYHHPRTRSRSVHWLLEELGAPYQIRLMDLAKGVQRKPEFLVLNPMGKLPTIEHRGTVVTETGAILTYLCEQFPHADISPAWNDPQRGDFLRWMFFAASTFEYALMEKRYPRVQAMDARQAGFGTVDQTFSTVESLISTRFVLGDRFSAVDILLSSQIAWALMTNDIPQQAPWVDYVKRCHDRPAYQRAHGQMSELAKSPDLTPLT